MPKTDLPLPLYPQYTVRGNDWAEGAKFCAENKADYATHGWNGCEIRRNSHGFPILSPDDGVEYVLGEIGLAYMIYRFRHMLDPNDARMFYRIGNYSSLQTLLNGALRRLADTGQRYNRYHFVSINKELMGILTSYLPVANTHISNLIEAADLDKRVTRWYWRPTEMAWNIQGGIKSKGFKYGVTIFNGETGHRALAFMSSIWTDSINGQTYQFDLPIREVAYARHMPTQSLVNAIDKVASVLEENKLAEAFEQFADLPNSWFYSRFNLFLTDAKARDTSKEKLSISFEDDLVLYGGKTTVDCIYQLLDTAANINKSAALLAHQIVNMAISTVMGLPRLPGGEVISDES